MSTPDSASLLELSRQLLSQHKAEHITALDVRQRTTIADYMLIASGTSRRQVPALAGKLVEGVKREGFTPLGVEADKSGEWVLVDLGDVIVHIMHPETRAHYQLEELWR